MKRDAGRVLREKWGRCWAKYQCREIAFPNTNCAAIYHCVINDLVIDDDPRVS